MTITLRKTATDLTAKAGLTYIDEDDDLVILVSTAGAALKAVVINPGGGVHFWPMADVVHGAPVKGTAVDLEIVVRASP